MCRINEKCKLKWFVKLATEPHLTTTVKFHKKEKYRK